MACLFRQAVDTFGADHQMVKAMEELSELSVAIAKYMECTGDVDARARDFLRENVSEEMADVEIMLAQLKIMLENSGEVAAWRLRKRKRLERTIDGIMEGEQTCR